LRPPLPGKLTELIPLFPHANPTQNKMIALQKDEPPVAPDGSLFNSNNQNHMKSNSENNSACIPAPQSNPTAANGNHSPDADPFATQLQSVLPPVIPPPPTTVPCGADWEDPADNSPEFHRYIAGLPWNNGKNHTNTYFSFLRAATFGIPPQDALTAITKKIEEAGGFIDPEAIERQCERAYFYVRAGSVGASATDERLPSPKFEPDILRDFAAKVNIPDPKAFLRERSPVDPSTVSSSAFLEHLYCPGVRFSQEDVDLLEQLVKNGKGGQRE